MVAIQVLEVGTAAKIQHLAHNCIILEKNMSRVQENKWQQSHNVSYCLMLI